MLVLSLRATRQLDHNPLLEVDEDIAVHGQLEVLYLHNTRIRRLNDSASYLYRLRELWISDTAITRLDPGPWVRNITCHVQPGQSSRAVPESTDSLLHTRGRRSCRSAVETRQRDRAHGRVYHARARFRSRALPLAHPSQISDCGSLAPRGAVRQGCRSCRT